MRFRGNRPPIPQSNGEVFAYMAGKAYGKQNPLAQQNGVKMSDLIRSLNVDESQCMQQLGPDRFVFWWQHGFAKAMTEKPAFTRGR